MHERVFWIYDLIKIMVKLYYAYTQWVLEIITIQVSFLKSMIFLPTYLSFMIVQIYVLIGPRLNMAH